MLVLYGYLQKEYGLYWWDYSGYWDTYRDLISSFNSKGIIGLLNSYGDFATSEYPPTWSLVLLPIILLDMSSRVAFSISLSLLSWVALAYGVIIFSRVRQWPKIATTIALVFLLLLPGVWAIPILGYPDQMAIGLCSVSLALLCSKPKTEKRLVLKYITVISLLALAFIVRKTSIFLVISISFVMITRIFFQVLHFKQNSSLRDLTYLYNWKNWLKSFLFIGIGAALIYLSRGSFLSALNRNGNHELIYRAFKMDSPSYFYGLLYFNGLIPFLFAILLGPLLFLRSLYNRRKSEEYSSWPAFAVFCTISIYLALWTTLLPVGTQHHLAQWVPWLAAWFLGEMISMIKASGVLTVLKKSNPLLKLSSILGAFFIIFLVVFCISTPVISSFSNYQNNHWKNNLYIPQLAAIGFPTNIPIIAQPQRPLDRSDSAAWIDLVNKLNASTQNSETSVFFLSQSQETNSSLLSAALRSTQTKQRFLNNSTTVFDYRDENYLHQLLFADYIISDNPRSLVNPVFQRLLFSAQDSFNQNPIWTQIYAAPRKLDSPGVLDRTLGGGVLNSTLELWVQDSTIPLESIQNIVRDNIIVSDRLGAPYNRFIYLNSRGSSVKEPNGYNGGLLKAEVGPKGELFLLARNPSNQSEVKGLSSNKKVCLVKIQRATSWNFKNGVQIPFADSGFRGWNLLRLSNLGRTECHVQLK